jgi:hypothetical protein
VLSGALAVPMSTETRPRHPPIIHRMATASLSYALDCNRGVNAAPNDPSLRHGQTKRTPNMRLNGFRSGPKMQQYPFYPGICLSGPLYPSVPKIRSSSPGTFPQHFEIPTD